MALTEPLPQEIDAIKKLDKDLQQTLQDHRVPFVIRAALANKGYTLMGDFVGKFDDKADVKAKAPAWLGYAPARPDHPTEPEQEKLDLFNVRLAQAWETANIRLQEMKTTRAKLDLNSHRDLSILVSDPDQEAMRQLWAKRHEDCDPLLAKEGSKSFLGLVIDQLAAKSWGLFANKKAVSRAQEHIQRRTGPGHN
jgi:hypothetical protein